MMAKWKKEILDVTRRRLEVEVNALIDEDEGVCEESLILGRIQGISDIARHIRRYRPDTYG